MSNVVTRSQSKQLAITDPCVCPPSAKPHFPPNISQAQKDELKRLFDTFTEQLKSDFDKQ